jgi:hypothetical protein
MGLQQRLLAQSILAVLIEYMRRLKHPEDYVRARERERVREEDERRAASK